MEITASLVKELRDMTGAGMMDCKKALVECQGDLEEAKLYLEKKGIADSRKRAGRVASEGLVTARVGNDGRSAFLLEVNCETDFVARNDEFIGFVDEIAEHIQSHAISSLEELAEAQFEGKSFNELVLERSAKTGEKMQVRRLDWVHIPAGRQGGVGHYIHAGGKIGVVVAIATATAEDSQTDEFATLAKDISMHIAASEPLVVSADRLDADRVEKQKEIFSAQASQTGKPPNIVEKIMMGRLNKWQREVCLVHQPFVKDMDRTVENYMAQVAKQHLSGPVEAVDFIRYRLGEGIEKVKSDLAQEIAKLTQ